MLSPFSIWPVHNVQRLEARGRMVERLSTGTPTQDLGTFRFPPVEFTRSGLKDDVEEFEMDGVLYDVVDMVRETDGTMLVRAVRDDGETALLVTLDRLIRRFQDEREQDDERSEEPSWNPFHEHLSLPVTVACATERMFPVLVSGVRGMVGGVEHGPPRLS